MPTSAWLNVSDSVPLCLGGKIFHHRDTEVQRALGQTRAHVIDNTVDPCAERLRERKEAAGNSLKS
jgi:hypothetical protein